MKSPVSLVLVGVLAIVLVLFGVVVILQYNIYQDVWDHYKDKEGGKNSVAVVMDSFDKTLSTLVAFITALATGILGYLGGSQGKKEAQEEASQAKGAVAELANALQQVTVLWIS